MLLTIGMIVKNEEKNLDRCLSSLKPILDSIDSELIIADTGSDDSTVEIARRYTDNVFHFEWIKDFAAARNSTIEKAKGEWYMFIDADEFIQSCDEIIEFFSSGEYKKYLTATYVIRNYSFLDSKDHYSDLFGARLAKMIKGQCFIDPVHESFKYFSNPTKYLFNTIADHYGYAQMNDGTNEMKKKRNIEILEKVNSEIDLKTLDPNSLIFLQLFEAYRLVDNQKALDFMEKGLDFAKEKHSIIYFVLLADKVDFLLTFNAFEPVLETCDEYFDINIHKKEITTDAEMYGFKAETLYRMKRYGEAVEVYLNYFNCYKRIRNGKLNTNEMTARPLSVANQRGLLSLHQHFIDSCFKSEKFRTAYEYMKADPVSNHLSDKKFVENRINAHIILMKNMDSYKISVLVNQLDEAGKALLVNILKKKITKSSENKVLVKYLEQAAADDPLTRIYSAHYNDNNSGELIYDYISKYGVKNSNELLYFMLKENLDISRYFAAVHDNLSISTADFEDFIDTLCSYEPCSADSINSAMILSEAMLQVNINDKQPVRKLFYAWGRFGAMDIMNSSEQSASAKAASMVSMVRSAEQAGDMKKCFSALDQIGMIYPAAGRYAAAVKNEIDSEMKQKKQEQQNEFNALAKQLKDIIFSLIREGNQSEAERLFGEYRTLVPSDPELKVIKSTIESMR